MDSFTKEILLRYLAQLLDSNDLLQSIVSMKALLNFHGVLITPTFKGVIPEETRLTEKCLRTLLYLALVASNTANLEQAPLRIAVRIMEPANYAKTKKQLMREHDYIARSHNESVYPIQLEDRGGAFSRMVLVGSQLSTPRPSNESAEIHDMPLSSMLCQLDPEADESFKDIGYIACPAQLAYRHRLYQDISVAWKPQITLEEIIADVPKFKTFHSLAVQLALSYVYLTCLDTGLSYPRLLDFRYYDAAEPTEIVTPGAAAQMKPEQVLEPYLCVGFGAKAPKQSTRTIGALASRCLFDNEAMTELGVLLHQVGTWKVIPEKDLSEARTRAKAARNELIMAAGMPYSESSTCALNRNQKRAMRKRMQIRYTDKSLFLCSQYSSNSIGPGTPASLPYSTQTSHWFFLIRLLHMHLTDAHLWCDIFLGPFS